MIQVYLSPFLVTQSFSLLLPSPLQEVEVIHSRVSVLCGLGTATAAEESVCEWFCSVYGCAARSPLSAVTQSCVSPQPNVPCTDNVAFDMERLTRGQPASRRSALGDFGTDSSLSLEPLRTSGMSQLPQDGELTPRSGEINIAVTSKCPLAPSTVLRLPWCVCVCVCPSVLQGPVMDVPAGTKVTSVSLQEAYAPYWNQ